MKSLVFTALVSTAAAKPHSELPSFLFILGDDIGWADMSWNGGTANTPRMAQWAARAGSILLQDSHSAGTVCSPTRASVLTGRTPLRDCINGVYGCSDMTECVPDFEFGGASMPARTFTIGDAARAASPEYVSQHWAKWHLGSFFNDSEAYGGKTSSPITHGFDRFNSTVEVAPTGYTNCQCKQEWAATCYFGHNDAGTHCQGGPGPDPDAGKGCCFNYWWEDATKEHGISNLTEPVPGNEAELYVADSFDRFLGGLGGKPFVAQLSFHNCHIPFVGTPDARELCRNGTTCTETAASGPLANLSSAQMDFYACLNELDGAVGRVLDDLDARGYGHNTLTWLATDNGPEVNCAPEGRCPTSHYVTAPGVADPLRGRKRDIWEGGHRIPSVVSWPAVVQPGATGPGGRISWEQVVTSDFLTTIMDVLNVSRPAGQAHWGVDGRSILPLLKAPATGEGAGAFDQQTMTVYADGKNVLPVHPMGWMYNGWDATDAGKTHLGFRYGQYKYVRNSKSCGSADCKKPMLFDLSVDLGEHTDLSTTLPDVFAAIEKNFTFWYSSVLRSIVNESLCESIGPKRPTPAPSPPAPGPPSSACQFEQGKALSGGAPVGTITKATSQEDCCGYCQRNAACAASAYHTSGECTLRKAPLVTKAEAGAVVCVKKATKAETKKAAYLANMAKHARKEHQKHMKYYE